MNKILILGGYGNFGRRISIALAKANIPIIISGRDKNKATLLLNELSLLYPKNNNEISIFDIDTALKTQLEKLKPIIVIHTAGPFQTRDYSVANLCIQQKIHYIDLADGRDFVNGITSLNKKAIENKVLVISGASTVPGLSSAVLTHYINEFSEIDSLVYGITPGQKSPRGLATIKAILTYLGKPLKPYIANNHKLYGWQDIYRQDYPELGKRWMANCDVPDFDLFPKKYGIKLLRFSAGMESGFLHLGMWFTSYLIRFGLPLNLSKHAASLLTLSNLFNCSGSTDGGMHMLITGKDRFGNSKQIKWFIIAKNNDGPQIPCVPAIVLTKKLFNHTLKNRGAMPCVGMLTLKEYMDELRYFSIKQVVN